MNNNFINCYECKHFYVTWNNSFPKGCRMFGFKTAEMPSIYVFKSSGEVCKGFMAKESK